jgi:hypothetical protein
VALRNDAPMHPRPSMSTVLNIARLRSTMPHQHSPRRLTPSAAARLTRHAISYTASLILISNTPNFRSVFFSLRAWLTRPDSALVNTVWRRYADILWQPRSGRCSGTYRGPARPSRPRNSKKAPARSTSPTPPARTAPAAALVSTTVLVSTSDRNTKRRSYRACQLDASHITGGSGDCSAGATSLGPRALGPARPLRHLADTLLDTRA